MIRAFFRKATCIGLFALRSVAFISSRSRALPSLDGTCCSTDSGTFSIRLQTIWIFCFLSLDRICRPAKQIQQYKRLEIEEISSHFSNNSVVLCRWWSWQCLVFHRRSFYRFKWLRDSTQATMLETCLLSTNGQFCSGCGTLLVFHVPTVRNVTLPYTKYCNIELEPNSSKKKENYTLHGQLLQ